jgi:putative endonuclease
LPLPAPHLALGERGEAIAARHLGRQGYKVLLRHYRSRAGEIDIVARDGDTLVFVEVKTRRSEQFGQPSDAVDLPKQRHIAKVAFDYVRRLKDPQVRIRFDIVEVVMGPDDAEAREVRLIQNAFEVPYPFQF